MKKFLLEKNVRVRCKKSYPDAHTHVIIGKIIEENATYVAIKGRTFHFKKIHEQIRSQIHCGDAMVRIIPWANIEVVHWISEKTDYNCDICFDENGNLALRDKCKTIIAAKQDSLE